MSKHHTARTTQQVILDRIRSRVVDLTERHVERVSQWVRSSDGTHLEQRETRIEHPSLIVQLHASIAGSTAGASSSGYRSQPAANLSTLDALAQLERESMMWLRLVDPRRAGRADMRAYVVTRLWRLVDVAPTLTEDRLAGLDAEVLRWWGLASMTTTWADPPWKPHIPCPECQATGKMRVTLTPTLAVCLACGTAWDGTTIDALGEHIRMLSVPTIDAGPLYGPALPPSLVTVPRAVDDSRVPDVLRGLVDIA